MSEPLQCACDAPGWCHTYMRQIPPAIFSICHGDRLTPEQQATIRRVLAARAAIAHRSGPFSCSHRGEKIGEVPSLTCAGRTVQLSVFSCPVHQRCVLYATRDEMAIEFSTAIQRGESPETWLCLLCKERQPMDQSTPPNSTTDPEKRRS